jgi:hypothetical protein
VRIGVQYAAQAPPCRNSKTLLPEVPTRSSEGSTLESRHSHRQSTVGRRATQGFPRCRSRRNPNSRQAVCASGSICCGA